MGSPTAQAGLGARRARCHRRDTQERKANITGDNTNPEILPTTSKSVPNGKRIIPNKPFRYRKTEELQPNHPNAT